MNGAGILDIKSRTENWTTAKTFSPLIVSNNQDKLATLIIKNATNKTYSFNRNEVHLELFWKGFRDYYYQNKKVLNKELFVKETCARYNRIFPDLRKRIEKYSNEDKHKYSIRPLEPNNYICDGTSDSNSMLYRNLFNTEIDVVISTPGYLLVGEAKDEADFNGFASIILTHQLIREYVTASIISDIVIDDCRKTGKETNIQVIFFVIGKDLSKYGQVQLMENLGYLHNLNIFSWGKMCEFIRGNS